VDNILSDGKDIFALELDGKRLMKYDLNEKKCQYFNILCDEKKWGNYASYGKIDNYFYIFPTYKKGILKVDLNTGRVKKITELYSEIENSNEFINQKGDCVYFSCGSRVGNKMWLFRKQDNLLVIYDMDCDKWENYKLPIVINDCIHAVWHNNKMYILSSEGKIYYCNLDGIMEEIADCNSQNLNNNYYSRIMVTDENIILLPFLGNNIFIINLYSKKIKKFNKYPIGFQYCGLKSWSKYYGYTEDDKNYYLALCSSNYMLVVNKKNGEIEWVKLQLPEYKDYIKIYVKYNREQVYEKECGLKEFLVYGKSDLDIRTNSCFVRSQIWEQIKGTPILK